MRTLALAGACVLAAVIALPAFADIKSFNAAVNAGDFKKAAVEAVSTWPTLDKSRKDIAVIAREFGFVSYVVKDYAAAKVFAEFAAGQNVEGDGAAEAKTLSNLMLRAVEYRLKPSEATRDTLFGALEARAVLPSFDNISFAATEAVISHDLEKGRWRDATASTELAVKLASAGGPYYAYERRKYELYHNVADYRVREKADTYGRLSELIEAICGEAAAIPSDKAAKRFVELFWEAWAWRSTLSAHLTSRGVTEHTRKQEQRAADEKARWERFTASEQLRRRLGQEPTAHDPAGCQRPFDARTKPDFPTSASIAALSDRSSCGWTSTRTASCTIRRYCGGAGKVFRRRGTQGVRRHEIHARQGLGSVSLQDGRDGQGHHLRVPDRRPLAGAGLRCSPCVDSAPQKRLLGKRVARTDAPPIGESAMTSLDLRLLLGIAAVALAACSPGEAPDEPVKVSSEAPAAEPSSAPSTNVIPPQSADQPAPLPALVDMSPTDSMPACRRGLIEKGLSEAELDIMLGPMAGVCPNNGVSEGRIREILNTIWTPAGCHQHGPIEVAKALDSGACGGDAG